jgi:hypothetical protein
MKYAVEMGPGVKIYIPGSINIGSGIQKLIGGDSQTHGNTGLRSLSLLQESRSRNRKRANCII